MKTIQLFGGYSIIVDDEDYDQVAKYVWSRNGKGYAIRSFGPKKRRKQQYLHHFINGKPPAGMVTDHINHDKLDNRRSNLRIVTVSQNGLNRKNPSGVHYATAKQRWVATIQINKRKRYLGQFADRDDAVAARRKVEKEISHVS